MAEHLSLHPETPQRRYIPRIVKVFEHDGLVVYPTDSGYSVGCNARSKKAIRKLYQLKRGMKKYIMALMFHDFRDITEFAQVDNFAFRYMKHLLPGPYTIILPATNQTAKILDVKRKEVGVRMPDHPFFAALAEVFPGPVLNTAAQLHSEDALSDPEDLLELFKGKVDLIVDMGPVPIRPTTVISLVDGEPEVLRPGAGPVP